MKIWKFYFLLSILAILAACKNQSATANENKKPSEQPTINWRCAGTEPFWAVEISPTKNAIIFSLAGEEPETMSYQNPAEEKDTWTFITEKIKVFIKKEECSDGMSDIVHQYSSLVHFNGQEWKGCAFRKE